MLMCVFQLMIIPRNTCILTQTVKHQKYLVVTWSIVPCLEHTDCYWILPVLWFWFSGLWCHLVFFMITIITEELTAYLLLPSCAWKCGYEFLQNIGSHLQGYRVTAQSTTIVPFITVRTSDLTLCIYFSMITDKLLLPGI